MAIHKVNGVLVRVATFSNGSNRKHGNFAIEHTTVDRVTLDRAASVKVAPTIPGNSYKLRRGFPKLPPTKRFDKELDFAAMRLCKVTK